LLVQLDKLGEQRRILGVPAGRPRWKRRWVNISKLTLTYHTSETEAELRIKPLKNNVLHLTGYVATPVATEDPRGVGVIELVPYLPHLTRTWVFRALGGEAERDVWLAAFRMGGCLSHTDPRGAEAVARARKG
jgi:hypothetical protein